MDDLKTELEDIENQLSCLGSRLSQIALTQQLGRGVKDRVWKIGLDVQGSAFQIARLVLTGAYQDKA